MRPDSRSAIGSPWEGEVHGIAGFVLAGFALAGSPGPATLSLAATGAAFGAWRGLGYLSGIVGGMIVVMAIVATGVAGMLMAVPGAAPVIEVIAAAYFAWLAARIATAPPLSEGKDQRRRPSFAGGVLLSLVNPKGYAAMAALFSGFVMVRERLVLDAGAKMLLLLAIMVAVNIGWLCAGAALTRFFREPRSNRLINVTFAGLLIASLAVAFAF